MQLIQTLTNHWNRVSNQVGRVITLILLVGLSGCANIKAAGTFGAATGSMSTTIRSELDVMDTLCLQRAELATNVGNRDDDVPRQDCKNFKAAEGRLGQYTLDLFDALSTALNNLADDKNWSLSRDISNVGTSISNLKDKNGVQLVKPESVGAVDKVANLVTDIATAKLRRDAVKHVIASSDSMKELGDLLKSFFVQTATAPISGTTPPYQTWIEINQISLDGIDAALAGVLHKQEPIRARELRTQVKDLRVQLAARGPTGIPLRIGEAIDTWKTSVDTFKQEGLESDPKTLYTQLRELAKTTKGVKDAIEAARN